MDTNDDFYGKEFNLNCFYMHINFEQKYPKTAIVMPDKTWWGPVPTTFRWPCMCVGTFIHSTTTYNLCNLHEFAKFEVSTPLHFGHNSVVCLLIPEFGMNSKVLELQNEN